DLADEVSGHGCAVVQAGVVVDPLPDLRAGDLGGGGVFHDGVYGGGADARGAGGGVLDGQAGVCAAAGRGEVVRDFADAQKVGRMGEDILPLPVDLVEAVAEDAVELGFGDGNEVGVGNPGAVEAVVGLALLVLADTGESGLGDGLVAAVGDEC